MNTDATATWNSRALTGRRRREDGQALIELALILPIFLLMLLGIVQFGTVFRDYIALTDATRVGARQASVARSLGGTDTFKTNAVIATTKNAAVNLDRNKMTVTVTPLKLDGITPGWEGGGQVTVRAEYPFRINLIGLVFFTGTVKSRTTERVE
jgi:Flp pilus assembly protein TadG